LNLTQLFDLSLTGRRDTTALEWRGCTFTFGDLDAHSNRLAHLLAGRDLRTGDRLAVYLANCVEWIDLYLACVKLGVIVVPVNILYRDREIAHILGDAEPAVVAEGAIECAAPVWHPAQMTEEATGWPAERPEAALDGSTPAALVYTSGTTGGSKGAVLTHDNFAANAVNLLADYSGRPVLAGAAFVSRAWAGQRFTLSADERLPDAAAGAVRTSDRGADVSGFPPHVVFRRAHDLCPAAGDSA
jgi:acyl-CoA synthetase (AMP-forming)/AMP-acid ligase II